MELDYASGDPDPNVTTPLSQFVFAEDTNVGLLLFEHVMAFQTARASAAGVETLRRLGATTYPAEVVNTRGSFTNAVALFPQIDVRPANGLQLRAGVLFAWADAPVIDPVASLQARDGTLIEDDLINFVGAPAVGRKYYGTELDARLSYRLLDHVNFELEGAILLPGDALQNRQGEAVNSYLVQGRTTAFF
jgi:Alginate export